MRYSISLVRSMLETEDEKKLRQLSKDLFNNHRSDFRKGIHIRFVLSVNDHYIAMWDKFQQIVHLQREPLWKPKGFVR